MKLTSTLLAVLSFATTSPTEISSQQRRVTVEAVADGTQRCGFEEVERRVEVCDGQGECRSHALRDAFEFNLPEGGSYTLAASSTTTHGGVFHASSTLDRFHTIVPGPLYQVLELTPDCIRELRYRIREH